MATNFDRWNDRIAAANEPASRRALLAEVARWRAQRLTDIEAMREATYAISRLLGLLGDHEAAVREARSLVSLCHTQPAASEEEYAAAMQHLRGLGEPVPKMPAPRPERAPRQKREREPRAKKPREGQAERKPRAAKAAPQAQAAIAADGDARAKALELARGGDFSGAIAALEGRRGAPADLLRAWLQLSRALAASGDARERELRDLESRLRRRVGIERPAARVEVEEEAGPVPEDPLSQLLGRAAPRRRERRIEAIEQWVREHPERVDEIAAVALRHHVETSGLQAPAPWLAGVVGQALARDGEQTRAVLADLREKGAFAVTAYEEPQARRLVALLRAAFAGGWTFEGMRRGVISAARGPGRERGEPADRKIWTLRLGKDGVERMAAIAPSAEAAYPEGAPARIAERLTRLCARTVLVAPGEGNAGLRDAAEAVGIRAFEEDPADDALLDALSDAAAVEPVGEEPERAAPEAREPRPAREPKAEAEPKATREPPPDDDLVAALGQDDVTADALLPIVQRFRRRFRAIAASERALGARPDDAKVAALLTAVAQSAEPDELLPEGTTLAVRAAAIGGERAQALLTHGATASRFGGPGIDVVVDLARSIAGDGWEIHRVLRGPTRREQRDHPVLETLGEHLQGLWRLLVRRGDVRGEVWYVAELPVEGRAALPQLLVEERQRAVVLPIDRELLEWYGSLRGPEPIGWTGDDADTLRTELAAWTASEAPAGE